MSQEKPVSINQSLKVARVYPREGSTKEVSNLKTLTLDLTPEQAEKFGSALRAVPKGQGLKTIRVVAFREPEKDGTHRLAIRALKTPPAKPRRTRGTGTLSDEEEIFG